MPEVKRIWRINGTVKPQSPAVLAPQAMEYDLPADWHGLANGITVPRGRHHGTAHFLILDEDLEGLQGRANNIQCYHEGGTTTFKNWYVESSQAITKQGTPAHWVRFADPRWLLENSCSEGKRYNLRSSESGFIEDTTVGGGGTPYTWAEVIADLWTFLPAGAGAAPSLAATPSSTPENLYFDGLGAWRAINQTLTAIGQCIVYNPFTGTFSIVNLTVAQTISYPENLLFDGVAGGSDYALPEKAGVLYHLLPGDNDYFPFKDKPWYLEASIGGEQGTHEIVDTTFYYDGRDLTGRTTEIANALGGLLDPKVNPEEKIYSGIWAQVPGSRISAMRWVSDGTRGMQTMLFYDFEPFEWPSLPDYEGPAGDTQMVIFELTANLDSGIGEDATAVVVASNDPELDVAEAITVYNTGMSKGYSGARGLALKINTLEDGVQWWVIEVDQYCLYYAVTLTSDTHGYSGGGTPTPGSRADQVSWTYSDVQVLTPYPFSFFTAQTIHNPFNVHGKTGDILIVKHVEAGYDYDFGTPVTCQNIVVDVKPDKAREFFINLTSDVGTGDISPTLAAKGWGPIGNNSGEIPGAGETPLDRYYQSHLGKIGHTGIVSYDLYNEVYVVKHMEHWATRVKCTLAEDFCDTPADFDVTPVDGMNGETPSGTLTVQNRYDFFAGKTGDPIDVLWDQIEGEWYPERDTNTKGTIRFEILSLATAEGGDFDGLTVATVLVLRAECHVACLVGQEVDVVDDSGCVFNEEDIVGREGWATWSIMESLDPEAETGDMSECFWAADDLCCP